MLNTNHPPLDSLDPKNVSSRFRRDSQNQKLSSSDMTQIENLYRSFLWLCRQYPGNRLAPSRIIDDYWHQHILDTKKYEQDCSAIFGYFLHHAPTNEAIANTQFKATIKLVAKHFPELV